MLKCSALWSVRSLMLQLPFSIVPNRYSNQKVQHWMTLNSPTLKLMLPPDM